MDLHQQPQGQPVNTDLKNHSLLQEELDYYQSSFNIVKQPNSSPQNTVSNQGQQVFRQLDQQHLTMSVPENSNNNNMIECTSMPHSYIDTNSNVSAHNVLPQQSVEINPNAAANSTTHIITVNPKDMERIPANTSQTSLSVTNSSHPLIHSNVISNTDQNRLATSQLPISNNTLTDGAVSGIYNNNSLNLPHDGMFSMSSLPNSISLNQPSAYTYLDHPVHQQLQQQSQEQFQNEAQRQANVQIQASQTQVHLPSHSQMPQQPPSMLSNQPNIEHHPVVPSHRTLEHSHTATAHSQHTLEEEQGRIDAATQHVMAQQMAHQYAMLQQHITSGESQLQVQKPLVTAQNQLIMANGESLQQPTFSSQDTHHIVLSQMTMLSPSSTNNIQQIKGDTSLHDAVIQQQYQKEHVNEPTHNDNNKRTATDQHVERRKSRRHTVSNSNPSVLNIDTNNVHVLSSSPKSAAVLPLQEQSLTRNEVRQVLVNQQNEFFGNIDVPLPLNFQELETTHSTPSDISANNYDKLSRAQLISRLIKLETEKRQNMEAQNEKFPEKTIIDLESAMSPTHQELMLSAMEEEKSTADEDEDEEDEPELEEQPKKQKMQCRWKECRLVFDGLQTLIDHVNSEHIGSGKPSYFCEWENCPRNEKPFTKRHKMYNHLRTHTGERPFICTEEGCGKKFSRPDSLSTHIKTHSNIRPFICRVKECGKAYYHARSLKKHEKSHEITATIPGVYFPNVNAIPFNTTPFGNTLPGHVDYLNSQFQHSSAVIHNQSLPNSPHHSVPQQGITALQSSSPIKDNYTLSNDLLFSSAGMVEQQQNNTRLITQQQLLDSVNLQQNSDYNYGQI